LASLWLRATTPMGKSSLEIAIPGPPIAGNQSNRTHRPPAAGGVRFRRIAEARFASLSELHNRRLRQREEGRGPRRRVVERRPAHDPRRGVVVGDRLEPGAVEALYAGLARASASGPGFDLDRFRAYLERQVETIRARTGCRQVRFRLEPDGEGLKLKAKPL
jgi:hypothetical protein